MDNITALVSAFARAYHYKNNSAWVFADNIAERILSKEEYRSIARSMSEGVSYFAPEFAGTKEEALRFIVDHQLAPSVLARSAFCESAIENTARIGCRQVVVFASGYDTLSLRMRNKEVTVFELDKPEMILDKQKRMAAEKLKGICPTEYVGCDLLQDDWKAKLIMAGLDRERLCFGSLLGISYYFSKDEFESVIRNIASLWSDGSSICFDYPLNVVGTASTKNRELAAAAGERMKAEYTYDELERMLAMNGFLIYEHMNAEEATNRFFSEYNEKNPEHVMHAPDWVGYCLAVKNR